MSLVPSVPAKPRGGLGGIPGKLMAMFGGHSFGGGYMRGEQSPTFSSWAPTVRDPSDMVRAAYVRAAGRANDLIVNSGWLTGGIEQAVANTVGTGLRLSCLPDAEALGWTEDEATEWGDKVEDRFSFWCDDPRECDIEGRRTFGQMQAAAFRSWFGPGEIVSENAWKLRPGCVSGTKVRLIPAHRLAQRSSSPRLVQGVQMDADWMPLSYWFWRREFPSGADREIEIPACDRTGRPRINHIFDGVPGMFRGISPLVSAIETARKFDQLSQSTLTQNLVRAVFAAVITSDEPTDEVLQGLLTAKEWARLKSEGGCAFDLWAGMQEGWYHSNPTLNLGEHGRIAHMFPGQKLEFLSNLEGADNYKELAYMYLREIYRCLGLTFESGTGDYSGATYSSVRSATGEIFAITNYRRKNIVSPFCASHYRAWLEEEIAFGRIPFPGGLAGFWRNRAAATRHEWVGSPMPQADALKAQKAHEGYRAMGVMTDETICNDLGTSVRDVYKTRAREMRMRKKFGLPENGPMTTPDPVAQALLTEKEE